VGLISGRGFLYLDINPSEKAESQLHLMIACRYDQRVKDEGERAAEDYPQNVVPASDRDGYTQSYWDALFKELGDRA